MIEPTFNITKEEVLAKVNEEDIFSFYLNVEPDLSSNFTNPLRSDKKPGCRFYYNPQGRLKFKDFSRGYNWDCFNIVQERYSCNFYEAVQIVAKDFGLIGDAKLSFIPKQPKTIKPIIKGRTDIKIKIRDWNDKDLEYWNRYKIDQFYDTVRYLTFMGVYPCKAVWINGEYYRCITTDPCYAYYFGKDKYGMDIIKLYYPLRPKTYSRFMQNLFDEDLQGYNKLPETGENLLITKSYKDVICLRLFGIYAIAPHSETVLISDRHFQDLYNRFDFIGSLMDNDRTGKHMAWLLRKKYEIPPLLFPNDMEKDFSDNLEEIDILEMNEMIEYYKQII